MEKPDLVVAIVGVLVVAAAGAGIAFGGEVGLRAFTVAWQETTRTFSDAGEAMGEQELHFTFDLSEQNLTIVRLHFTITAAGPRTSDEEAIVIVTAPTNETVTKSLQLPAGGAARGELEFEFAFATTPTTRSVTAASAMEAEDRLQEKASRAGTGPWQVVAMVEGSLPVSADVETHSFSMVVGATRYFALLEPPLAR